MADNDTKGTPMSGITNTTANDPIINFVETVAPGGIEATEARGQRELVNSTKLPTEVLYSSDAAFEALGFIFCPPDSNDPLFRDATLPSGWKKEGSDHAMWSFIVDERGLERASVFYKAAFYDRSAHMGITNVGRAVANKVIYDETGEATIPWDILTDEEAKDVHAALADYLKRAEEHPSIYGERVPRVQRLVDDAPHV